MRVCLTKLKTTLLYKNLINNFHFIVIGLVNIGLIYKTKNILFVILLVLLLIYLFKKNLKIAIFAVLIFSIFILGLIIKGIEFENRILGEKKASMVVIEANKKENGYSLVVKNNKLKYQLFTDDFYEVGDIIYIKGTFVDVDSNHIPLLFNYQEYSKYHNIIGRITTKGMVLIKLEHYLHWLVDFG